VLMKPMECSIWWNGLFGYIINMFLLLVMVRYALWRDVDETLTTRYNTLTECCKMLINGTTCQISQLSFKISQHFINMWSTSNMVDICSFLVNVGRIWSSFGYVLLHLINVTHLMNIRSTFNRILLNSHQMWTKCC
jgi:hypothetical protein